MLSAKTRQQIEEVLRGDPVPTDRGVFGTNCVPTEAALVLLPVPWGATASYGGGADLAPDAIRRASHQLDYFDPAFGIPLRHGIASMLPDARIAALHGECRRMVEHREDPSGRSEIELHYVNSASTTVNDWVEGQSRHWLKLGKTVGVIGGDHSCPYGLIKAIADREEDLSILHIDAHFDLRNRYEGYAFSHASIMFNLQRDLPGIRKIVHVGIRDFSRTELEHATQSKVSTAFLARDLFRRKANGDPFAAVADAILDQLSNVVYISLDVDGLEPVWCPSTGTPVPGGLLYDELTFLLERLVERGKRVVGFDLCEVVPSASGEWDQNVGARLLYKLCGAALA